MGSSHFIVSRFFWSLFSLVIGVVEVSGEAHAELSTARAEALVLWDEARAVWEQGNDERAEALLRQSFTQWPSGRSACDLGRLLRERGSLTDAAEWFERCSAQDDVDEDGRERARAEARALRDRQGRLHLTGGVEGAAIFIDDEFFRRAPVDEEVRLRPGPHELLMVDRDGLSTRRTVEVRPAVTTDFALPTSPEEPPPRRSSRAHRAPRWAVWMMTAVTVAAAVGTFVTFGLDFQASSEPGAEDRAATMRLVSAVLGGVAGASLGVTLVLIPYAFGSRADRQDNDDQGDTALLLDIAVDRGEERGWWW